MALLFEALPLSTAALLGCMASCWLGWRWRLETFSVFNGIAALVVFLALFFLGLIGALVVYDTNLMTGREEPSFLAHWMPLGTAAVLIQVALGALRGSLAR